MKSKALPLRVPFKADLVASPIVAYGDGPSRIEFPLDDEESWGRVTFEKLDSLRVSRGEYVPVDWTNEPDQWSWVNTVTSSAWLLERHEYEKRHYESCYEFCGDVDEMLRDYHHYLFKFHDEFVEAIAAGIWLESSETRIGSAPFSETHPLSNLPESAISDRRVAHGIPYDIRKNPRPVELLLRNAVFCSQKLFQFGITLDGRTSIDWTLHLRTRQGKAISHLCGFFGNVVDEFDRIARLEDVMPRIDQWLGEVAQRRAARK